MKNKSILMSVVVLTSFLFQVYSSSAYSRLPVKKILVLQEEYRVTGYRKTYNGWEKVPLKIRVTQPSFGKEKVEVIAYHTGYGWMDVSFCYVLSVSKYTDGEDAAASFEYKASCAGTVYFNF
jgi:hypothetical protein